MTLQEIFDKVVAHAREQKARACGNDGRCAYRGHSGRKCFVGALIPDEAYSPGMEGCAVETIMHDLPAYLHPHKDALAVLQGIHDLNDEPNWEHCFGHFARANNLTYTPPA